MALVLLVGAGLLAYANSFSVPWVFDGADMARRTLPPSPGGSPWDCLRGTTRPVALASFVVQYALHGPTVGAYHAVNLAIHLLSGVLLFEIVRWTLLHGRGADRYRAAAGGLALAAALIWTVHPLQTASVTYLYQRFESLMGLAVLLSFYLLIRGMEAQRSAPWYAASIVAYLLAVGTKEVAVVLPALALWYDRALVAESWSDLVRKRGAYYGAIGCLLLVPVGLVVLKLPTYVASGLFSGSGVSALDYAMSQPGVIVHYLRLAIWPQGQCLDYAWPVARTPGEIIPPALVVAGLLAATLWAVFRRPGWGFLGGVFFLILAPTSSIFPIRDLAFEHRMYLPLAAVVVAAVLGVHDLTARLPASSQSQVRFAAALGAVLLLTLGTLARNAVYQNEEALWADNVRLAPHNARARVHLGNAIRTAAGSRANDPAVQARAAEQFAEAVRLDPRLDEAHNNLANLLKATHPDQARRHYDEALRLNPNNADAHNSLASLLFEQGRYAEAIDHLHEALRIRPQFEVARKNLEIVLRKQKQSP